jgi:hypothetical protein
VLHEQSIVIPAQEAVSLLDYGSVVPADTFSKNSFENKAIFPAHFVAAPSPLNFTYVPLTQSNIHHPIRCLA